MKTKPSAKALPWLILTALVLTWGSSFILMKKGLKEYTSIELGAMRVAIVMLAVIPFIIKQFKKIPANKWKYLIAIGIVGNAAPAFLFAYAQTGIDSYLAGILNALSPLFTLILGVMFFKVKGSWAKYLGVTIGLAGAVGLIWVSGNRGFEVNMGYGIFIIIATLCYAFNVNVIKNFLYDLKALHITGFAYLFTGVPCLIYLLAFTPVPSKIVSSSAGFEAFLYIFILGVFGTAIALTVFNYLIKVTNALFASSVTYMIPIVALLWGIIDGEVFKPSYLVWIALILLGVYLVNKRKRNLYQEDIKKSENKLVKHFNT